MKTNKNTKKTNYHKYETDTFIDKFVLRKKKN